MSQIHLKYVLNYEFCIYPSIILNLDDGMNQQIICVSFAHLQMSCVKNVRVQWVHHQKMSNEVQFFRSFDLSIL